MDARQDEIACFFDRALRLKMRQASAEYKAEGRQATKPRRSVQLTVEPELRRLMLDLKDV